MGEIGFLNVFFVLYRSLEKSVSRVSIQEKYIGCAYC